jgi:hypothetical protein
MAPGAWRRLIYRLGCGGAVRSRLRARPHSCAIASFARSRAMRSATPSVIPVQAGIHQCFPDALTHWRTGALAHWRKTQGAMPRTPCQALVPPDSDIRVSACPR